VYKLLITGKSEEGLGDVSGRLLERVYELRMRKKDTEII
jgi:hypothetical protein